MVWNAGQRICKGYYLIEQKLGEGGFGITYRATNPEGHFEVIKTLRDKIDGEVPSDKLRQDFYEEAAVLFKLRDSHRHDPIVRHLVQVNNLFMEGDLPCFAMEYIPGEPLKARMAKGVLGEAEALQYIEQVGQVLALVHREGLLHRDIKPDNIMLREGNAEAVLIDFGIARKFIPDVEQTQTAMRTDGYAPPEQYDPKAQRGAFIDVYALAATLYALLTGYRPVAGSIRKNACDARQPDPLKPLIQVNPNVSSRVSDAVMRGMALDYRQRPQSVGQWLARLLGVSSAATTPPPETAETTTLTNLQAIPPVQAWEIVPINSHYVDQLAFSPDGKMLATYEGGTIKLWDVATGKEIDTATAGWAEQRILMGEEYDRNDSVVFSDYLFFSSDGKALVGNGFVWALESGKITETRVLKSPFKGWNWSSNAISPDLHIAVSVDKDAGIVKLWEASTGAEIHTLSLVETLLPREKVRDIYNHQFSPDGKTFASLIYLDGQVEWKRGKDSGWRTRLREVIKLWDVETGKELCSMPLTDVTADNKYTGTFTLSSDGRLLASNSGDDWRRVIVLWDTFTGKELCRLQGVGEQGSKGLERLISLTFSPDNYYLVSGDSTGTITLWKLQKGLFGRLTTKKMRAFTSEYKSSPRDYAGHLVSLPFSPDGQTLAYGLGSKAGGVVLWDVKSGQKLKTFSGHLVSQRLVAGNSMYGVEVAVSPDGKTIATNDNPNSMIKLWDTQSGAFLHELSYKSHRFDAEKTPLVTEVDGKSVKIKKLDRELERIGKLAFSQDGRFLVGVLDSSAMHITPTKMIVWDVWVDREVELKQYPGQGWWCSGTVNQYGDLVAFFEQPINSYSGELKIQVLEVRTGQIFFTLTGDYKRLEQMAFSLDKRLLVVQHSASELTIWNLKTGQLIRSINTENEDQDFREHPILVSPNGEILAIAATENITLWKVSIGEKIHTIQLDTDRLGRSLAFSPDGRTLVFSSGYGTSTEMKLWDVKAGNEIGVLGYAPLQSKVTSFVFSSDGQTLVSSYSNGTIQVWQQK